MNPGPGGWGAVLIHTSGDRRTVRHLAGGEQTSTNNRMELMAVSEGLAALTRSTEVTVHTDSSYVMYGFTKNWIQGWRRREWRNAAGKPVANRDLWEILSARVAAHRVSWDLVKGHRGIPMNERADKLAAFAVPPTRKQAALIRWLDMDFDKAMEWLQ